MVTKWFTAKRMAALRPGIEAMADRLVDDVVGRGHPADLKAALAFPLPVWVICDMLGAPDSDRDRTGPTASLELLRILGHRVAPRGGSDGERGRVRADPWVEPVWGVTGGDAVPASGLCPALRVGHTLGSLPRRTLNRSPRVNRDASGGDRAHFKHVACMSGRTRGSPMVTPEPESAFRANPGIGMPRYIGEDVRVGDTVVPRGTTVMCSMAASNHDETAFEGADDMTLGRSPNVHLSFGSGAPLVPGAGAGPHRTAGRPRRAAA